MLNVTLICALIAWFAAQFIKIIITLIKERKFNFVQLWASGGMPSSHTSTVVATATCCGYVAGWNSTVFAVACVFAIITMYDAAGVRRAVGEQAKILNQMTQDIREGNAVQIPTKLKELVGHTPLQVFMGALLGLAIGFGYPILVGAPYAG